MWSQSDHVFRRQAPLGPIGKVTLHWRLTSSPPSLFISLSLSGCVSLSVALCLSLSPSVPLSLCPSLPLSFPPSVFLPLRHALSPSLCLCVSLSLSLSLCLSLCLCVSLSVSPSPSLSLSPPRRLRLHQVEKMDGERSHPRPGSHVGPRLTELPLTKCFPASFQLAASAFRKIPTPSPVRRTAAAVAFQPRPRCPENGSHRGQQERGHS